MDQIKIGKFIAKLRHEKNLTQEALGKKLGVTNKTISRWENGIYMPNIEMLQILSKEFNVDINELLCGERIKDEDYHKKAEENLVAALENKVFSLDEKYDFWKNKWLKEHIFDIVFYVILFIVVYFITYYINNVIASILVNIMGIGKFLRLRNEMAGYIEGKIYNIKNEQLVNGY